MPKTNNFESWINLINLLTIKRKKLGHLRVNALNTASNLPGIIG